MSIDSEKDVLPEGQSHWKWLIGCGVAAIIFLCVGLFVVLGGIVGITQLLGDDSDDLTAEVIPPESPLEAFNTGGEVLLSDAFDEDTQNWEVGEFEGASVDIVDGQMVMDVFTDNLWAYSLLLDIVYENVNLVVDVEVIDPEEDGNFGFICMFQDEGNFSALQINQQGYYSIWGFENSNYYVSVDWTYSELISSRQFYTLGAHCRPDRLALYLDGTLLGEATPPNDRVGNVGLIAGTYDNYPLIIGFDNFKVLSP